MSWTDVFGMVIATTSVVITIISVFVAYLLSRSYLKSIKEMDDIRSSSEALSRQIRDLASVNSSLLRESMLAVRTIFDLIMLVERRENYEEIQHKLLTLSEWRGEKISEDGVNMYRPRVRVELQRVNAAILARQTELYWLVGQSTECEAHLHALQSAKGDERSIDLLESIRDIRVSQTDRDKLLIAASALRARLGKQMRPPTNNHESRSWTGRSG